MSRLAPLAFAALVLAACSTPPPPRPQPAPSTEPAAEPPPPRPEALVAGARALRAEGDVAGAQERLEMALELAPGSDEVRVELADLLVADGGDLVRAEALLASVAGQGGAQLHLVLARLAEAKGDDASAAAEYMVALDGADDPDARLRLALALERLGRAEATEELERVRAARPNDLVARSRLAERYEAAARLEEAEAEYRWLVEAQPYLAAPWERLAGFYARCGRAEDARAADERSRVLSGRQDRELRPLLPSRR